ncbi:MAG: hypothetical protein WCS73_03460 [Lentisphaeria bacterium]
MNIIKVKQKQIKGILNERSRRIWAVSETMIISYGGITIIIETTKLSRNAINHGISDIKNGKTANKNGRNRRKGAGRKN